MSSRRPPFAAGLHELGDGLFCYLQPDGGWGWSNAGLVVGDGGSLLVDTLFDVRLTAAMLADMAAVTREAAIATVVNTHANGDHCFGNQLVADAEIIASDVTATEMQDIPPDLLHTMVTSDLGDPVLNEYARECFGAFRFDEIELTAPTRTFSGHLDVNVAGVAVELHELGPAHTGGDVIVHVPAASTAFVGDLAFIGGTPIVWAGPLANWCAAIDHIIDLGVDTIVPGHGPVCGPGELAEVGRYLAWVDAEATGRFHAGMSAAEAVADIDLGPWGQWGEAERIVANVATVYRHLDPAAPAPGVVDVFAGMAHWRNNNGLA
jgi:glyoxylase-like metal-dependent hydrolase (beta-lactamase superfamily II)